MCSAGRSFLASATAVARPGSAASAAASSCSARRCRWGCRAAQRTSSSCAEGRAVLAQLEGASGLAPGLPLPARLSPEPAPPPLAVRPRTAKGPDTSTLSSCQAADRTEREVAAASHGSACGARAGRGRRAW